MGTLVLGLWLARRNRGEEDYYFVAGRRLSGWLAGASMAATTFSIDTPSTWPGWSAAAALLVTGSGGASALPMWRWRLCSPPLAAQRGSDRRGVYRAALRRPAAAWLRGIKAFLLALPVNCIGIGYAFLALRKVVEALGLVSGEPMLFGLSDWLVCWVSSPWLCWLTPWPVASGRLWSPILCSCAGALLGAMAVAWAAVHAAGGMTPCWTS